MDAKNIAYIIYLIMMFVNGCVSWESGLTAKNWQRWVLALIPIVTYLCGCIRGEQS